MIGYIQRKNFIQDCLKIMDSDEKIIQVWLESKEVLADLIFLNMDHYKKLEM